MRDPVPGLVGENSGTWWPTSAALGTRPKRSTSSWSRTSTPTTSAALRLRMERSSFQMPTSMWQRQITTFGYRRKLPLRRRRKHKSSSRVHKASLRPTSRPESGTRLPTPIKSLTACKSYLSVVIPRDILVMNFRPKERRFYFGATSCTYSAFSCQTPRSQWYLTLTRLQPRSRGINCCVSSRARMSWSRGHTCSFLESVACTGRGVPIIGRQWHLLINGTRNSNAARQADSSSFSDSARWQNPYRLARLQQFPWRPMADALVGARLSARNHRTEERRTYGAVQEREASWEIEA